MKINKKMQYQKYENDTCERKEKEEAKPDDIIELPSTVEMKVKTPKDDIVYPSRLQGFSDAVFATAATLLIVPIRKFEEKGDLQEALREKIPEFIVFILGYLVICTVWESHIIRYKLVQKVDDLVIAVTLFSLMITTFLPFTVALEVHYGKYGLSIVLNCIMLLLLEITEACILIYVFHRPNLLNDQFKQLSFGEKKVKKRQLVIKILLNVTLFVLTAVFSFGSLTLSWVVICIVIISPLLRRLMVKFTKMSECCHGEQLESKFEVLTGRIDKERIECFSDAAIAIVATLLILDLTAEDFPTKIEIEKDGLKKCLLSRWGMFVSYVGTYTIIGFLWFVHHSVIHHINVFTPLMNLINKFFLAFLAVTPFISTLVNKYTTYATLNARMAIRFSSCITFLASFANVALLAWALFSSESTLHDWAVPKKGDKDARRTHNYLLLKTLIIPMVAFFTFLTSFGPNLLCYVTYHVAIVFVPLCFILLKIVYNCSPVYSKNALSEKQQHNEKRIQQQEWPNSNVV